MRFSDLKYLLAYLIPLSSFAGLYFLGWASAGAIWFGFVVIPLLELFVPAAPFNQSEAAYQKKSSILFFDNLLYLNVLALYFILGYFLWTIENRELSTAETIFCTLNVGVMMGVIGINVAHELGHRSGSFPRWISRLLLLPPLYSHFTMEHNYGHHLKVGTPEDPATARKNESVYLFYVRSIVYSYLSAWSIGFKRLEADGLPKWRHEIIWAHIAQVIFIAIIIFFFGWSVLVPYLSAALIAMLTLESVNYIEHYGLFRKKLHSGRYEPTGAEHSWNSNHEIGRIVLFELVRHADHHQQTTRKYQMLRHLDKSPQLPFGYPMSIALALIPPLWFMIMNPKLEVIKAL